VQLFDMWTPLNDPANSGYAAAGMFWDGLHLSQKGALAVGMAAQGLSVFPPPGNYKASQADKGTKAQPAPNPTFLGTLGAGNAATGYSGGGTVTLSAYGLNLLADGVTQEQYINFTGTAAQIYLFRTASFTTIPGQKYRISMTVEVIGGVGLDSVVMQMNQQSDSIKYADVFQRANGGYADGSYTITSSADYVCHATLTAAYLNIAVALASTGGAMLKMRNWELRAIA
jgi:hypothetical protein